MTILEIIRAKVLPLIQPTAEENEALTQLFNILKSNLEKVAERLKISPSFIQNHGSTGLKQTHLHGRSDLDIFIGLNPADYSNIIEIAPKKRKEALKDLFFSYLKEWFIPAAQNAGFPTFQINFAEHPYLIIYHKNYEINIVGCFDLNYDYLLTHGPLTAVDRTPWHSKIIAEKLSFTQKQDVRLLKAFFQANYVYGDKAIGRFGFTGFSAEVLILFYQNIEQLFSYFQELSKTALDFFNRPAKVIRKLRRFEHDFLIIIDPTDQNRNLASSVTQRAFEYALFQVERFLKDPSPEYFLKKPIPPLPPQILVKYSPHLVVIEFESEGTIHYTELRDRIYRACEKVRKLLEKEFSGEERFGKTLYEVYFEGQIFAAIFYCEHEQATPTYIRKGPPITNSANVRLFLEKHPKAFMKDDFYYASIERQFQKPLPLITDFFSKYKIVEGLSLLRISHETDSPVGQRAVSLMVSCILPLYEVINS